MLWDEPRAAAGGIGVNYFMALFCRELLFFFWLEQQPAHLSGATQLKPEGSARHKGQSISSKLSNQVQLKRRCGVKESFFPLEPTESEMFLTKSLLCGSLRTPVSQKAGWVSDKKGIYRIVAYKQIISQCELLS